MYFILNWQSFAESTGCKSRALGVTPVEKFDIPDFKQDPPRMPNLNPDAETNRIPHKPIPSEMSEQKSIMNRLGVDE